VLEGPPTDEIRTVFQKRDVDMLIADVQPSQHDSLAIAKWWRSRCPSKPILFLGELGDPCWGEWLEDRAAGLIPRPVQPTRLLQRVAEMLAGRRTSWA
jgi:DNA-binding response OmpR family regulator